MCGIVGGFNPRMEEAMTALAHRGPDGRGCWQRDDLQLGHVRLAVMDLDERSGQPFRRDNLVLVYNGELWNYLELRAELAASGERFTTPGDTEVVAAALLRWGAGALPRFQGMFALAWSLGEGDFYLARDRHGEVPLHWARALRPLFASELKALLAAGAHPAAVRWFPPGCWARCGLDGTQLFRWYVTPCRPAAVNLAEGAALVRAGLCQGVEERTMTDVPACLLLSGGIDSAAIAALLAGKLPGLVAYVAVHDPRSADLTAARQVAAHVGLELREVAVAVPNPDDLAAVVRAVEMPHKAQVEIGWPCLHLARRMQEDGFKVTFSGEGSDELWASYGFAERALLDPACDWHAYRARLFDGQHRKNFARCNKVFMARGVECRLPFLCTSLVEAALSLPRATVQLPRRPKAVMQEAFADLLPPRVVARRKLAFQDGMGLKVEMAGAVHDPARYYRAEFRREFRGVAA